MQNVKKTFLIAFSYIGAVIGAGFASGQEIMVFFVRFGANGLWGILIAALLFMVTGAMLLWLVYQEALFDYQQLIFFICGKYLGCVLDVIITLFLWSGFAIMLAGSGAVAYEYLGIHRVWGIIFMAFSVSVILMFGIRGVFTLNAVLIPCLLIIILVIGEYVFLTKEFTNCFLVSGGGISVVKETWPGSTVLYVGYNLLLALAFLTSMGKEIESTSMAIGGGLLGGMGLGVMAMVLGMIMTAYFPEGSVCDVPMIKVAQKMGLIAGHIYSFVLWIAMLTTAVANIYGLTQRFFRKSKRQYYYGVIMLVILALPLSFLGFTKLITVLYPVLGYFGIIFMFLFFIRVFQYNRYRS